MLNFLKKNSAVKDKVKLNETTKPPKRNNEELAGIKGEIGEHKIDIQLSQLPKDYQYINDLMIKNPKSKSGYSQIDHVVISPHGIFVIETKNYQGTIYGGKDRKTWLVNGKFKFMNPLRQNYGHIKALKELIDPNYHNLFVSIVSFTKRCTFKIDVELRKIASNQLIVYDIELSEFIHRKVSVNKLQHPEPMLSKKEINDIYNTFISANIEDKSIRDKHNEMIKDSTSIKNDESRCVNCDKSVSEKVEKYCLSNKKFNGKIYCFDCQKKV